MYVMVLNKTTAREARTLKNNRKKITRKEA